VSSTNIQLLWLELPTNPLLFVPPLPLISRIISSMDPATRPIVVVDTTFLSPFYCTPLIPSSPSAAPLGDIVLTSLSKYGSGHSDIILGSLVLAPHLLAARPEVLTGLRFIQNSFGGIPSPRDCHLMSRSLKTLSVRVLRHGLNALRIAHWLEKQPGIEEVRYPGLKTSPAFALVQELLSVNVKKELEYLGWTLPYDVQAAHKAEELVGEEQQGTLAHVRTLGVPFGGVVSFRIRDATEEKAEKFMTTLRLPALAESLGGVESLVEAPYGMTHAVSAQRYFCGRICLRIKSADGQGLPEETRAKLGITPSLIRLSVGIEDVDDLLEDLEQALKVIGSA
jgi:cystathionine gamma-lyase